MRGGESFAFGEHEVQVLDVGGHTLGHIAYHVPSAGAAFVGGWLAHIAITTLLGLYYFTERLQVSDRRVRMGKSSETHQKDKAAPDAAG